MVNVGLKIKDVYQNIYVLYCKFKKVEKKQSICLLFIYVSYVNNRIYMDIKINNEYILIIICKLLV